MVRDMDRERDWTPDQARTERVDTRTCLNCRRRQEDLAPNNVLFALETNEKLCRECLERFRRHRRDLHIDVWVDDEVTDEEREVVRQSFRYLRGRLDRPARLVDETENRRHPVGLDLAEVDVAEDNPTRKAEAVET